MSTQTNSWSIWSILGLLIIGGWLLTKLPDWLTRVEAPEISINDSFFEKDPENGTVDLEDFYDLHIRISPENVTIKKAELKVTVNGHEVEPNCGKDKYWCYHIDNDDIISNSTYYITATNSAGTAESKIYVKNTSLTGNQTTEEAPDNISPIINNQDDHNQNTNSSCTHYENGKCWDDLELEAESAGNYDKNYGYYGASIDYPDDCDQLCQDIIEDAYSEGYDY